MFMPGIIKPEGHDELDQRKPLAKQILQGMHRFRYIIMLVILPTLIAAGYYYLIASDQYEATADFVVRRADASGRSSSNSAAVLGFSVGGGMTQSDAFIVTDYLLSHDAVARLRKEDELVERFRRPFIDFLSVVRGDNPSPEKLLKYYRKHVLIEQNVDSSITELNVRAFTPQDAHDLAHKLLQMGEERVNQINERAMQGQVSASQRQLTGAETELANIQQRLTTFRRTNGDIDPAGSGKAQIGLVSQLTAELATARARLNSLRGFISQSSPQYRAIEAQVRSLEQQANIQNAKLAGAGATIATGLGTYEDLLVRQEFAAKRYSAAAAAYDEARAQAVKQQLYLVRVVDPNLPVKSQFPERGRIIITIFFSLAIAYGIGWLMLAGVREHKI